MQQTWIKLLVMLSTVMSVHAALALPISSIVERSLLYPKIAPCFAGKHAKTYLAKDKLQVSLELLLQQRKVQQLHSSFISSALKPKQLSIALANVWSINSDQQVFLQQKNVFSAIQAYQNHYYHKQVSYQANRQLTFSIS